MALGSLHAVVGRQFASFANAPLQFTGEFLEYAIVFSAIAVVAAVVGARGIAGVTMELAKWFVVVFLVLAIVSVVL